MIEQRMKLISFSVMEGDVHMDYLSDYDRFIEIIDDHCREHLANIETLFIFFHRQSSHGYVEITCDELVDEEAWIPPVHFKFEEQLVKIVFKNE
jgi:hypothetical protein